MDRMNTEWRLAREPQRFSRASLTWWTFMKGFGLTFLMVVLLLQGCRVVDRDSENRDAGTEEKLMELERINVTREVAIPPIDAAAPTRTETATFALG